ncbi:MAG: Bax inhibitor-1/YccA family protein [Gemmatimonadetes bacterium]|nr:Bax inhibitor-1/YccA family protein [Gemmatimonadota bacterium]
MIRPIRQLRANSILILQTFSGQRYSATDPSCLFHASDVLRQEDIRRAGAPKRMEWYCGFVLLVSLAWIYYEAAETDTR